MGNLQDEFEAVLLAAAHEMTHYLRQNNEQGYTQLRDFVVEHLMEDGVDIEELAHEKIAREKNNTDFTMDDAMEEVIADSCELMLEDTRLPDIMARENPSLLEQIRDWLKDFTQKLRTAFMGVEAKHTEAKAMLKYADELQQLWDNAMAEAVRNGETARENTALFSEKAKMSNRQKEEDTIKRQIKDNLDSLNSMKPVTIINDKLDMGNNKGQYHKWIVDKLASTGYQVERKGFGRITFTPKQLNTGINYVNDKAEMAAFLAIPKVLKQGIEIQEHDNHKSRGV